MKKKTPCPLFFFLTALHPWDLHQNHDRLFVSPGAGGKIIDSELFFSFEICFWRTKGAELLFSSASLAAAEVESLPRSLA